MVKAGLAQGKQELVTSTPLRWHTGSSFPDPHLMNPLWIDTDLGFDDLAAVLAVTGTPAWSVAGLSLMAGNAPLPLVIDNALRAAACFGWRFPIHAGAAGPLVGELATAQSVLGDDGMRSAGRS